MSTIDRRQFIIMGKPYDDEDFLSTMLPCGLILSYHKDLKIRTENGNTLLGLAFSADGASIDLTNAPEKQMYMWAGRWVLLTPDALYLDACGHMGVFYTGIGKETVLSGSLHLLQKVTGCSWSANHAVTRGETVFDFYPIPYTPYEGVLSLLPSEYFSFAQMHRYPREDFDFDRYTDEDPETRLTRFINGFQNVMHQIDKEYHDHIWIPLTGGVDSRTVLALASCSEVPVKTYTIRRDDTKKWDLEIPPFLAKKLRLPHLFLDHSPPAQMKQDGFIDVHCGGKVTMGTERAQILARGDVPEAEKSVILWGTTWELGTQYYWPHFPDQTLNAEKHLAHYGFLDAEQSNVHANSLKAWLAGLEDNHVKGMDWRERLYWEQRQGAWLRYAFQALDMLDSDRVAPVNCQYLLELFISANHGASISDAQIQNRAIEKEIISRTCPQIAKIRFGEPTDIIYRAVRKMKKILQKLRH